MKENKMKYEYEVLKVGDADAILIRHYIGNEQFIILIDAGNAGDASIIKKHLNDTDINIKDIVINVKSENENLFSDNLNKEFNQDRRFNQNNSNKNKKNNNQIIEELHNSEHNKDDDNLNILI